MLINRRQFNCTLMGGLLALPLRGIPLQSRLAVNGKRDLEMNINVNFGIFVLDPNFDL